MPTAAANAPSSRGDHASDEFKHESLQDLKSIRQSLRDLTEGVAAGRIDLADKPKPRRIRYACDRRARAERLAGHSAQRPLGNIWGCPMFLTCDGWGFGHDSVGRVRSRVEPPLALRKFSVPPSTVRGVSLRSPVSAAARHPLPCTMVPCAMGAKAASRRAQSLHRLSTSPLVGARRWRGKPSNSRSGKQPRGSRGRWHNLCS
jgi:hypothetical protein